MTVRDEVQNTAYAGRLVDVAHKRCVQKRRSEGISRGDLLDRLETWREPVQWRALWGRLG